MHTIQMQIGTVSAMDNPNDSPYARGAAAGRRLADRLRDRPDWQEIFADMRIIVEAARSERPRHNN